MCVGCTTNLAICRNFARKLAGWRRLACFLPVFRSLKRPECLSGWIRGGCNCRLGGMNESPSQVPSTTSDQQRSISRPLRIERLVVKHLTLFLTTFGLLVLGGCKTNQGKTSISSSAAAGTSEEECAPPAGYKPVGGEPCYFAKITRTATDPLDRWIRENGAAVKGTKNNGKSEAGESEMTLEQNSERKGFSLSEGSGNPQSPVAFSSENILEDRRPLRGEAVIHFASKRVRKFGGTMSGWGGVPYFKETGAKIGINNIIRENVRLCSAEGPECSVVVFFPARRTSRWYHWTVRFEADYACYCKAK